MPAALVSALRGAIEKSQPCYLLLTGPAFLLLSRTYLSASLSVPPCLVVEDFMAAETIIGSYRIEERIGRGGMGVVYRGRHAKLPREVAIKSISPRTDEHDLRRLRHRFEREAVIQSQLDHPGLVKIYDYIVAEQTYYIVMEYVEGRSLAHVLAQPLSIERALYLFEQ